MKIVYLRPRSSFTPGLRSDTLWGLLCWGVRYLYGAEGVTEFIGLNSDRRSTLRISSVFKYRLQASEEPKEHSGNTSDDFAGLDPSKIILQFPKPKLPTFNWEKIAGDKSKPDKLLLYNKLKKFKKQKFLEKGVFQAVLNGEKNDLDLFNDFLNETENSKILESKKKEKKKEYFREEIVPHNTIDRLRGSVLDGAFFMKPEEFAANGYGLFFLMDGNKELIEMASSALRLLDHIGFGGDAGTGRNHFKVTTLDFALTLPETAKHFVSLSLYTPQEDELLTFYNNPKDCYYEATVRKGKGGGRHYQLKEFWKDACYSFTEGSVFPSLQKDFYGDVRIVLPGSKTGLAFDIYHSGLAFHLPIKIKEVI